MKASRVNAIRDIGSLAAIAIFIWIAAGFVTPGMQKAQLQALEAQYFDEQQRVVSQAVLNAGVRLAGMKQELLEAGLSGKAAEGFMLSQLGAERYGINGYGYFFVFDSAGTMLEHSVLPELEGRNIHDIETPDGQNLGKAFNAALAASDSAFVSYAWAAPGISEPEEKTTFILRLGDPDWIIASGFYNSDLQESLSRFSNLSVAGIRSSRTMMVTMMALLLAILGALSILTRFRILVTERALARQLLSLTQYRLILDESSMVSRTDPQGIITYVNDAFCEVTGHRREDVIGKSHNIERHPDTPLEVFRDLWSTILAGRVWNGIIKNRRADGSRYFKHATIVPILDEKGHAVEYISSGQDITELVDKRRELEDAFLTDSLTGLGNRIHLLRDMERSPDPCVVLMDIEAFSEMNLALGASAGDAILKQLARAVLDFSISRNATAYRVHADIFAVLMETGGSAAMAECAESMARRIKDVLIDIGGEPTALIVRIGVASGGKDCLLFADSALKRAKASRKMVHIFNAADMESEGTALENLATLKALNSALVNDRVLVAFQPIVDVHSRGIVKYECLMRIEDESGRILQPAAFLETSKKTGIYHRLTARIIERSIQAFRFNALQFSINLTIDDLMNSETIGFLVSEARASGVGDRLIVEIVETEELHDFEGAADILRMLRAEGMRIAVDDFGSGYSNFEYLLKLDPEYIKIDQAIVQNLLSDERAHGMLKSIVQFAGTAGMKTIAEFIDSEALLEEIRALGVDYAQGWLFGKADRALVQDACPP